MNEKTNAEKSTNETEEKNQVKEQKKCTEDEKKTQGDSDDPQTKKEETETESNTITKLRIGFWNIAGIEKKIDGIREYTCTYDVIGFVETWLEEVKWRDIEKVLGKDFALKVALAKREHPKGRAKGGIITGVKKHIQEEEGSITEMENAQERVIIVHGKRIRILTVYLQEEREKVYDIIKSSNEKDAFIVGGDFNARTGKSSGRKSKDGKTDKAGRELLKILQEKKLKILNGATKGDEEGKVTFESSQGSSVIDYAVVNEVALEGVERFEVENRTESDHRPIRVTLTIDTGDVEEGERNGHGKISQEEEENLVNGIKEL